MSLLDDLNILETNLDIGSIQDYLDNLPKHDMPAYWQAWYDLIYSKFTRFSSKEKQICLQLLLDTYPKHNLWDPGIVYHKEKDKFIPKNKWVDGILTTNPELIATKPSDNIYELIGVSDIPLAPGASKHIKKCIEDYIEYFMFKDTDVLTEEIAEILSTLHKLDPHQSTISDISIEKNDVNDMINHFLFPYMNQEIMDQIHTGLFHNDYHILIDQGEDDFIVIDHKQDVIEGTIPLKSIETKYDEISYLLNRLLDIKIKEENQ